MENAAGGGAHGSTLAPTGAQTFETQLENLRTRIDALRTDGTGEQREELLLDLETAYEELRVAEEEVRAQQEQIAHLVDDHQMLRWQHERMLAALPVPVVTTDLSGIVRSVNASAAAMLGVRVARLLGKPVFAFFDPADRPDLRRRLVAQHREPATFRSTATVLRQDSLVELTVSPTLGDSQRVTWMMLLPPRDGRGSGDPALPTALAALAALPTHVAELQELLGEAVRICRVALGDAVEVSLTTGSPQLPEAVATTSQLAQAMDGAQLVAGQGPCVSAFDEVATIWTPEVRDDDRWPALSPHVPAGIRSVIAVPLEVGESLEGALNVYGRSPEVDSSLLEATEMLGATLASVLYEVSLRSELESTAAQMQQALSSRAIIDQAKGIVMGDRGCDAEAAFAHLVSLSSAEGVKVREIARRLVEQSSAPHAPDGRPRP